MSLPLLVILIITIVVQATISITMLITYQAWVLVYNMKWTGFLKATNYAFASYAFFALFYILDLLFKNDWINTLIVIIACVLNIINAYTSFMNIKDLVIASD